MHSRPTKVRYDTELIGEYSGSIMALLKASLQKDPNKRPSSKKSFIALWIVAKPDVQNSSAAQAAYQAVEVGHRQSQSRLAPGAAGAVTPRKVVRTSVTNVTKAAAAATEPDPERGTGERSERSGTAPEASTELKPTPTLAPKPSGSFSFLRGFGTGESSGKDGKGSQKALQ